MFLHQENLYGLDMQYMTCMIKNINIMQFICPLQYSVHIRITGVFRKPFPYGANILQSRH